MNRRRLLQDLTLLAGVVPPPKPQTPRKGAGVAAPEKGTGRQATVRPRAAHYVNHPLTQVDARALRVLDEAGERAAHYFSEQSDPNTGLIYERAHATGKGLPEGGVGRVFPRASSIAATGFGLSALCIAAERGYLKAAACEAQVAKILHFFATRSQHEHGFYYHYLDVTNGARVGGFELSSIDTSLLLCGVLQARHYFNSGRIARWATQIYNRIDWPWMMAKGNTLSMGWTPEHGFIKSRWDIYAELLTMYLMAIGSPTHPISSDVWDRIQRPVMDFGGVRYITGEAPLFIHQYAHAWCDFRDLRDRHANYFANSVAATRAHQIFCMLLHSQFESFDENVWGVSASESRWGYRAWGGPPKLGPVDGTLVPNAAGGSLPFLPAECSNVLYSMRDRYPKCWQRYGFVDAFQPSSNWYCQDVIAIDLGIMMLAAENLRSGLVWNDFMKNREIAQAMHEVGFRHDPDASTQLL